MLTSKVVVTGKIAAHDQTSSLVLLFCFNIFFVLYIAQSNGNILSDNTFHETIRFVLQTRVALDNDFDYSCPRHSFAHAIRIDSN